MNDSLRWFHEVGSQEAYLRHEAARVADMCARAGGHPEEAERLERELCSAAGLPESPRNDDQPDLFAAHAA